MLPWAKALDERRWDASAPAHKKTGSREREMLILCPGSRKPYQHFLAERPHQAFCNGVSIVAKEGGNQVADPEAAKPMQSVLSFDRHRTKSMILQRVILMSPALSPTACSIYSHLHRSIPIHPSITTLPLSKFAIKYTDQNLDFTCKRSQSSVFIAEVSQFELDTAVSMSHLQLLQSSS